MQFTCLPDIDLPCKVVTLLFRFDFVSSATINANRTEATICISLSRIEKKDGTAALHMKFATTKKSKQGQHTVICLMPSVSVE